MAMNGYLEEEQFDGICEGLFDNIEDIFDFSNNDGVLMDIIDSGYTQSLLPPPTPAIVSDNKIGEELNVSEDWLSNILDDTNFKVDLPVPDTDSDVFRSSSPISVLEPSHVSNISSSSSSTSEIISVGPTSPVRPTFPARARTKRPRPATFGHARPGPNAEPFPSPAKKGNGIRLHFRAPVRSPAPPGDQTAPRKCLHCGIQKTPQWRAGPMGPKTLCNACGVRYKSGRLFPEYRPAASPTFVPSVHSNSHKKVVEMRIKATENDTKNVKMKVSPAAKNCDLLSYIRG